MLEMAKNEIIEEIKAYGLGFVTYGYDNASFIPYRSEYYWQIIAKKAKQAEKLFTMVTTRMNVVSQPPESHTIRS